MTTENTPQPDDTRFPEPTQGESLEMPEPTPVVADDGEVVAVHDDPVAAAEQDPEVVTGASDGSALTGEADDAASHRGAPADEGPSEAVAAFASGGTGSSRYTDEQLAGLSQRVEDEDAPASGAAHEDPIIEEDVVADLAADEDLDVESLREPSESERSWDYTNGPLEQVGPVQPTASARTEGHDVLEQDGTGGDLHAHVLRSLRPGEGARALDRGLQSVAHRGVEFGHRALDLLGRQGGGDRGDLNLSVGDVGNGVDGQLGQLEQTPGRDEGRGENHEPSELDRGLDDEFEHSRAPLVAVLGLALGEFGFEEEGVGSGDPL